MSESESDRGTPNESDGEQVPGGWVIVILAALALVALCLAIFDGSIFK